jgi:hypothetical protein
MMFLDFSGTLIYWRGPAPWYFVAIPDEQSSNLKAISGMASYGWGVIPVSARIGKTTFTTSLFPKDGRYLLPVKNSVRKAEDLEEGEAVQVRLDVRL